VIEAIRKAEHSAVTPSPPPHVTVCDINAAMLEVGKERAAKAGILDHSLSFVEGNAERLPFEGACMDSYTISFGLRNVTHTDAALRDAFRRD
jgi:demethylmenaquinone methyltransferase/2-methoxy-6-polyprenyl-1,4-benzoquinol methylase